MKSTDKGDLELLWYFSPRKIKVISFLGKYTFNVVRFCMRLIGVAVWFLLGSLLKMPAAQRKGDLGENIQECQGDNNMNRVFL